MTRYLDENSGKQIVIETNKALLLKANQSEITSARSGEVDLATKIGKIDSSLSESAKIISLTKFPKLVGETDDTLRLQRAIDYTTTNKMILFIPSGTYTTDKLLVYTDTQIEGESETQTTLYNPYGTSILYARNYGKFPNTTITGVYFIKIKNITLKGNNTGDGSGIDFYGETDQGVVNNCVSWLELNNIRCINFGGSGFKIGRPMLCTLKQCESWQNTGHGFEIINGGTSTNLLSCWGWQNTKCGYYISGCAYSSLMSCASDGNGEQGYYIDGLTYATIGFSMLNCGAETNTLEAYYFKKVIGFNLIGGYVFLESPSTKLSHIYRFEGCQQSNISGINYVGIPSSGFYTLYIGDIDGTASPSKIYFTGCNFGNIGGLTKWITKYNNDTQNMNLTESVADGYSSSSLKFTNNSTNKAISLKNSGGNQILQFLDSNSVMFAYLYESGFFGNSLILNPIVNTSSKNNSIFIDSADNVLKFKNSAGVIKAVTLT